MGIPYFGDSEIRNETPALPSCELLKLQMEAMKSWAQCHLVHHGLPGLDVAQCFRSRPETLDLIPSMLWTWQRQHSIPSIAE